MWLSYALSAWRSSIDTEPYEIDKSSIPDMEPNVSKL